MCRAAAICPPVTALTAWLVVGTGLVLSQEPATSKSAAGRALSAEQLAAVVRQLDADEFLTRESAMRELLAAGPIAIPALKPVLTGGSLEASSRALYLVRQLGLAADFESQEQAWALLTEMAARNETPTLARRAAAALEELAQQRTAQALAELEVLGARISRPVFFGGLPLENAALSVELGDGFRGEEQDLRRLRWLHDVPVLILSGDKVTDGWVKYAAAMPNLEGLHLYKARISDAGLAPLAGQEGQAGHATLAQVGIYYTPVGDAVLEPLANLPLLNFVKLYGTRITAEGAAKLKAASGVKPDYRRGAFLGVGCLSLDATCQISQVHDGSPADKAGILREDVIVRFGGIKVGNFDSLNDLISQRDAGDEVELEVVRRTFDDQGNQVVRHITTKVTFVPWDLELAVRNPPRR